MDELDLFALATYVCALGVSVAAALAVIRSPRLASAFTASMIGVASAFGGQFAAVIVTPDWSPITMFAAWIPFAAIAAWMFAVGSRRARLERAEAPPPRA